MNSITVENILSAHGNCEAMTILHIPFPNIRLVNKEELDGIARNLRELLVDLRDKYS